MSRATDIPAAARAAVKERDRGLCRVCGVFCSAPAVHHIVYRSQERNNHDPSNLVTLGGGYGHNCHQMVHAHNKIFQEALLAIVDKPYITALAWLRRNGVDISGLKKGTL